MGHDESNRYSHDISLLIANDGEADLAVCIEPWAEEHCLRPGESLTVQILAKELVPIPVRLTPGYATVEGWYDCVFHVWKDGERIS